MSLVLSFASIAAVLSMAATEPAATVPAPAEKPKKEKLVCKSFKVTGTRLGRDQICMTKAQWDFENDQVNRDHRGGLGKSTKIPAR